MAQVLKVLRRGAGDRRRDHEQRQPWRILRGDQLRRIVQPVARAHDKSQSYGSYTYGDPGTRFQRSYLGDPVKFRAVSIKPL